MRTKQERIDYYKKKIDNISNWLIIIYVWISVLLFLNYSYNIKVIFFSIIFLIFISLQKYFKNLFTSLLVFIFQFVYFIWFYIEFSNKPMISLQLLLILVLSLIATLFSVIYWKTINRFKREIKLKKKLKNI